MIHFQKDYKYFIIDINMIQLYTLLSMYMSYQKIQKELMQGNASNWTNPKDYKTIQ